MRLVDVTIKLLGLTEAMRRWQGVLDAVDDRRRERIARYAEAVAGTLSRCAQAYERLERAPGDQAATRVAIREYGRLAGYVEDILAALNGHVDGRRLCGLKRRLETIAAQGLIADSVRRADAPAIERLAAAEGYFRALADGLRL